MSHTDDTDRDDIAIVGMACRFPGAKDVDEFWSNLVAARESIRFFAPEELDPSIPEDVRTDSSYVAARGIVDDCDKFDARFFGISPAEATVMDPQQRLFMEVAYNALEDAGCVVRPDRSVGVFAGTGVNTYYVNNVLRRQDLIDNLGEFNVVTANDKDYTATRLAYKLDLRGPSVNVQTACSTSLVAIVQAVWSLKAYQCDAAVAGGASIDVPVAAGYPYQEGSMLSADGHCRPFDANANGTLFNSGVGAVVLKRLEDAIADNDTVYAVIRGAAINNDGLDKVSFTAPSVNGQADVVRQAIDLADISAKDIGYVEAHGTATPLGDPIEVQALTSAFRADTNASGFCGLGSVKSNVGHLVAAAGVAGLIKTALSLHHEVIPPTINFSRPNPSIEFDDSPFKVVSELQTWPADSGPRFAGVSSFGVGGTNAHVVLQDFVAPVAEAPVDDWQLLPLSAKSEGALKSSAARIADAIEGQDPASFADAAYTLQTGRARLTQCHFTVADSAPAAAKALRDYAGKDGGAIAAAVDAPSIAMLFPGQGSQHLGMAADLCARFPLVRSLVDECCDIVRSERGFDLAALLTATANDRNMAEIQNTANAQPALFAVEYAIARLWQSIGVSAEALVGHSIGEFVAACLAGVMSFEDAVRIVTRRGQLMQDMERGAMLSVRAAPDAVQFVLSDALCIAAINGPELCVLSGPGPDIEKAQAALEKQEFSTTVLRTSHAFHSSMMEPAVQPLVDFIGDMDLRKPTVPIVSTATGTWLSDDEATSPAYWGRQLRQTVQFSPAIRTLTAEGEWLMIECGPRRVASQLARQTIGFKSPHAVISSLGDKPDGESDVERWLDAVGTAWQKGVIPDWAALHAGARRSKRRLPGYPFERTRYWADVTEHTTPMPAPAIGHTVEVAAPPPVNQNIAIQETPIMSTADRIPQLVERIRQVFADTSGMEPSDIDTAAEFVEQGFDSLFLTQAATAVKREFGVKVTFRELMEDVPSVESLARRLDQELPAEAQPAAPVAAEPQAAAQPAIGAATAGTGTVPGVTGMPASHPSPAQLSSAEALIQRQLDIMQQQLAVLNGQAFAPAAAPQPASAAQPASAPQPAAAPKKPAPSAGADESAGVVKAPRAGTKINKQADSMTAAQASNLDDFVRRYNARTKSSKAFAQKHRKHFADPRTASGFRPAFKEMVYQVVMERTKGSRMWDIDGNEYIDLLNGFGSNMLGHLPDYVQAALHEQTDRGLEIGPQTALAGDVAELFCELSGMERMAFANTGSEAVAGAIRIARTVTGRNLIVSFDGDYHGIFDEVLVRGTPSLKTLPSSPGVPRESVANMVVLPFNDDAALETIREHKDDIAGFLLEGVQGGDPGVKPEAWLKKLRALATEIGAALIVDEVITGFRVHPRGAQGYFGIDADLATYGKVVGGGLPIGVIAGKATYMDALDGGYWEFGNNSIPEAGVTYFAGTFVRHPLTMAASKAALTYLKEQGPALQQRLNTLADEFAADMNAMFKSLNAPWWFENFGTLMNLRNSWDSPFQELLYYLLRANGVHIWNGRPCFLTDAHTKQDLAEVRAAFEKSILELAEMGFLEGVRSPEPEKKAAPVVAAAKVVSSEPPVAGARLGRDPQGNPGWFVPDPDRPGKYLQVGADA